MQAPIRKIVIVGGGTAGWMTAAAMSKFLGTRNFDITLVESEAIGTVGVGEATIPHIVKFNAGLGIDERQFVQETHGTFKLGIEFRNWLREGHSYFHPFGPFGPEREGVAFQHYWRRWSETSGERDYGLFNAETIAARAGRFDRADPAPGLPRINYAYHFDAGRYAVFLRHFSERLGVKRIEGRIVKADQDTESGIVTHVTLDDGRTIEGDLFVDCSGFKGLLIEETLNAGYEDWSHWLPVDRAVAVPCERSGPLLTYTRTTARQAGWQWRIPLQHRTGNGHVYSSQFTDEEQATRVLLKGLDGKPLAEPRHLRFVTGVRKKFWDKNVVAVGLSSGFLEPLESTSIHLIQTSISTLLGMFPTYPDEPLICARYNKRVRREFDIVKDFLIAHYHVTEREDTPFWRYVRHYDVPDTLKERLELFRERGEVIIESDELFKEASWFYILAGQGVSSKGRHPAADAPSDADLDRFMAAVRGAVDRRVAALPQHEDFIAANCPAPQPTPQM